MIILNNIFLYLTFPLILYLGILTSYTDLVKKKIYNNDLIKILFIGIVLHLISVIFLIFTNSTVFGYRIILNMLINSFFTLLTGFIIWLFNMWAAGDVKLLFVFSFLMPINYYIININRFFPTFDALVNTFVLAIIFILGELVISLLKINLKKISKINILKYINLKIIFKFIRIIFNLAFMMLIVSKLRHLVSGYLKDIFQFDMLYVYLIIFLFFSKIARFLQKNILFFISISGMIIYIIYSTVYYNYSITEDIFNFLSIGLVITMVSRIINIYLDKIDKKVIPLDKLKKNMLITNACKQLIEKDINIPHDVKKEIKHFTSDGLQDNQVQLVQQYFLKKEIEIENTFAFAPFIFLGVFISLFLKKSILEIIISLF